MVSFWTWGHPQQMSLPSLFYNLVCVSVLCPDTTGADKDEVFLLFILIQISGKSYKKSWIVESLVEVARPHLLDLWFWRPAPQMGSKVIGRLEEVILGHCMWSQQ